MANNMENPRASNMTEQTEDWELEVGSELSQASTAPRPSSRPVSRMADANDLQRLATLSRSNTIRMTTDAFEKLYLSPRSPVKGDLRQTFAVPTPIALIGFIMGAGPLGCALMGWRGSSGGGIATIGASYFFGGMLQIIGAVMEWLIGNTFPFVCFSTFGAFFLAYATIQDPSYGAQQAFISAGDTAQQKVKGLEAYEASLGFFFLFLGILVLLFIVCALRTNIVFLTNLIIIEAAICLLTASTWKGAEGNVQAEKDYAVATGACVFATCMIAFYLLFAQLLESVAFPITLPVGDLSNRIGRSKQPAVLPQYKGDV